MLIFCIGGKNGSGKENKDGHNGDEGDVIGDESNQICPNKREKNNSDGTLTVIDTVTGKKVRNMPPKNWNKKYFEKEKISGEDYF